MWMTVLMLFCAYMAFIYGPWDLLMKPLATDVDVWFGIALRGWAAKLSEPLHIAIYAAGAYGFFSGGRGRGSRARATPSP